MKAKLLPIIKLIRPRQWVKNFALFAAILFGGELFNLYTFEKAFLAFAAFCGISSVIYIINDLFDIKKDRLHPFKKFRPLAHGDISTSFALIMATFLTIISLWTGYFVTPAFFLLMIVYLILQLFYSIILKQIAVIDILALASGYILRVYAGEFATGLHISVWLLLTTISLSLFLAVGKRRSELTLVSGYKQDRVQLIRKTLSHYSERLLDVYASIFATSTFIFYSLFTFLESTGGFKLSIGLLMPEFLPAFFQRKWLMITIIPVAYGLMRYLQDIYEKHEGESPEKVIFSDKPLIITIILWILMVIGTIYVFG